MWRVQGTKRIRLSRELWDFRTSWFYGNHSRFWLDKRKNTDTVSAHTQRDRSPTVTSLPTYRVPDSIHSAAHLKECQENVTDRNSYRIQELVAIYIHTWFILDNTILYKIFKDKYFFCFENNSYSMLSFMKN